MQSGPAVPLLCSCHSKFIPLFYTFTMFGSSTHTTFTQDCSHSELLKFLRSAISYKHFFSIPTLKDVYSRSHLHRNLAPFSHCKSNEPQSLRQIIPSFTPNQTTAFHRARIPHTNSIPHPKRQRQTLSLPVSISVSLHRPRTRFRRKRPRRSPRRPRSRRRPRRQRSRRSRRHRSRPRSR